MTEFDQPVVASDGDDDPDRDEEPYANRSATPRKRTGGGGGGAVIAAAMLAVGEILEPEKTGVEVAEQRDDQDPDIDLDFGDLPPLD